MGRWLLIATLTVGLTVTACSAEAPGQPLPTPSGQSTTPSASPSRNEAPPINSPELDLASYESKVCDLLTLSQLAPFAIRAPGTSSNGAAGPVCTWNPPDTTAGAHVALAVLSKARNGWAGVYERRDRFAFFEDAGEINGYPAVHLGTVRDGTSGSCATVVGVSRDLVFDAGVNVNVRSSPEYKDACSVSDRVASLVIDTLKGGR